MHVSCQCMNISRKGKLYQLYQPGYEVDMKPLYFTSLENWCYMMPPFTPIKTQLHISQYRPGFHGGHGTAMRCGYWCDPILIHFDSYIITSYYIWKVVWWIWMSFLFFLSVWLRFLDHFSNLWEFPAMWGWIQPIKMLGFLPGSPCPPGPPGPRAFHCHELCMVSRFDHPTIGVHEDHIAAFVAKWKERKMSHKKEDLAMRKGEFPRKMVVFRVFWNNLPIKNGGLF